MSRRRIILTTNYIPYKPKSYFYDEKGRLPHYYESQCDKIVSNPDFYFDRVKIINFDLTNNECRGDDLEHDRKYHETLCKKQIDKHLVNRIHRYHFVAVAQRFEREDVRLEKDLQLDHFRGTNLKENLLQKGIYISSMLKCKKNTDCCKS